MALSETPLKEALGALESAEALDTPAQGIAKQARKLFPHGAVKDAVSGTWLGHALHPMLTDVVIGSFTSATLLDLLGGDDDGRAAERLIQVGLVAAVPTVASGLTDWALSVWGDRRVRPVRPAHATSNPTPPTPYPPS